MPHQQVDQEDALQDESELTDENLTGEKLTDEKVPAPRNNDDESIAPQLDNLTSNSNPDMKQDERNGFISEKHGSVLKAEPEQPTSELNVEPLGTGGHEWEYLTGLKLLIVIILLCLAAFVIWLDASIVATAIPRITSDFHSLGDIGWYGSAYLIGNATFQPLSGKLYANFSSKFVFLTFLGIFELGSLICGVATSSKMLIVGRAISGIGGSGLMNGSLVIVTACVPRHKAPLYIGICFSFAQLAMSFGPLIGGALTQYTTWRWCFYINLLIGGLVAGFLLFIHIPDRSVKSSTKRTIRSVYEILDMTSFLFLGPTTAMLLLAVEWGGNTYPWRSATIIGLFCGCAIASIVFVVWEFRQGATAMIPLTLVRNRVIASSCAMSFFLTGNMLIVAYYIAVYFQAVKGVTPSQGGIRFLPSILNQMVFGLVSAALISRIGYYLPFAVVGGIMNSIGTGLLCLLVPDSSAAQWIGYQILGGMGRGCVVQIAVIAVRNALPESESAVGLTLVVFCSFLGGVVFLSFAQTTLNNGLAASLPRYAPSVSSKEVAALGATGFRAVLKGADVEGVIKAYNFAVVRVFYLGTACAVVSCLLSLGVGWKSVRKSQAEEQDAEIGA